MSIPPPPRDGGISPVVFRWLSDVWEVVKTTVTSHSALTDVEQADPTSTSGIRNRHVSDNDMKQATDHRTATSAHGATGNLVGTGNTATTSTAGVVQQATAVTDLNQTISVSYTQAEIQAISDKVDELLAALRTAGILES